jgi:tRNA (guanine-N7-)-methyltransferase
VAYELFPYFRTLDDVPGVVDWREFFGNENPVELDIGCGRGRFLVESGLRRPEVNLVGLELDYKEGRRGAKRLAKRHFHHVRVVGGDARRFLNERVREASIDAAHVYFPDPWWKRRHRRRRIFTAEFATRLSSLIIDNGDLHSWTDVEDYFDEIRAIMDVHPDYVAQDVPEYAPDDYRTSFHKRRAEAGCTIYRGYWRRRPRVVEAASLAAAQSSPS